VNAMTLSQMFDAQLRRVRRLEKTHSTSRETEKELEEKLDRDCEIQPSAPSARVLVPRDAPWQEGGRYRLAGETDANRLDLFEADPTGEWLRHGKVLILSDRRTRLWA